MRSNPFEEFVRLYYAEPVKFAREVLNFEPDADQASIMTDVANGVTQISVRSGHGVGKTTTLAILICWFACTRFPQKTLATAPTSIQLFDALASETKAWFKKLPPALFELFEITTDRITLRSAPDESFVSFNTSRPEIPEALAGKHSKNMLLIADEASGIPEPVFEAAMGSMSTHGAIMILTGNPIRTSGLFFDTHHTLRGSWKTYHISCEGHPRCSLTMRNLFADRWGENSNAFRVRWLGEFPTSEDDVVIPFELMTLALTRDVKPLLVKPIWGIDCAYTGKDRTTLAKRKGNVLLEKVKWWKKLDTMQAAGTIHLEWVATPPSERPEEILLDVIGWGAGVTDRLRELGLPARGINVSESPSIKERYVNLRTELWFLGREWFEGRDCNIAGDDDLGAELTAMHYLPPTSSGKMRLEPTESVTKRLKGKSPDLASAFILTLAGTAVTALHGSKGSTAWGKALKRPIKGIV
jgi:phage terminase large subunit